MIYFTSNGKRPLHFAIGKDNRTLWVGSEKGLMEWILNRSEYGMQTITLATPVTACANDMLYSFTVTAGNVKARPVVPIESGKYFFNPVVPEVKQPAKPLSQATSGPTSQARPLLTLVKNDNHSVIQPTSKTKLNTNSIGDIPIFTDEELKDMTESSLKDLLSRVETAYSSLEKRTKTSLSILSDINWSDKVTWRKNTKNTVSTIMNLTYERERDLRALSGQKYRIKKQLERRNILREANENFKKNQVSVSPPPNMKLKDFKTLANYFTSESGFAEFMGKHKAGCGCCGAVDPLSFTVANSVLLKDNQGFICSNCAEKPSVLEEFIIPMAMRA